MFSDVAAIRKIFRTLAVAQYCFNGGHFEIFSKNLFFPLACVPLQVLRPPQLWVLRVPRQGDACLSDGRLG